VKIIVDTNIIFSALLSSNNTIVKLLIDDSENLQFFSCNFLNVELKKHHEKLAKYSKLSSSALVEAEELLLHKIIFINERLLPSNLFLQTEELLASIDTKDTPFVALTFYLKATLWTGDMKLYNGLKAKNFDNVITSKELAQIVDNLDNH